MPLVTAAFDRFISHTDAPDGAACWQWKACVSSRGYGLFHNGRKLQLVHRYAYEEMVGPIPEGLTIDHLCRNRLCVNPLHLEPVTRGENSLRGDTIVAANVRKTSCPRGHAYDVVNANGARTCRTCDYARHKAYTQTPEYKAWRKEYRAKGGK